MSFALGMAYIGASSTFSSMRSPKASHAGMTTCRDSPTSMDATASSNPWMTSPEPTTNSSGSLPSVLSNTVPSASVPR